MKLPKPPITSTRVMHLYLYYREKMSEETCLVQWQKEKEKTIDLKHQLIDVLKWEIENDLRKSWEEGV